MAESPSTTIIVRPAARRSDDERDPLMQREFDGREAGSTTAGESSAEGQTKPLAGGTILGIHNLAIVMPQFIVRVVFVSLVRAHSRYHRLPLWQASFSALLTKLSNLFLHLNPETPWRPSHRVALVTTRLTMGRMVWLGYCGLVASAHS